MSDVKKVFLGLGLGCGMLVALIGVGGLFLIARSPDTSVYVGQQVPKRFVETLRSLELLDDDEELRYFYSDGLLDIRDGMYFLTDQRLTLYSRTWDEPKIVVPVDQIVEVTASYDDSFFVDSYVFVTTADGQEVSFPVSSEKGLDKRFVEALEERIAQPVEESATGADGDELLSAAADEPSGS